MPDIGCGSSLRSLASGRGRRTVPLISSCGFVTHRPWAWECPTRASVAAAATRASCWSVVPNDTDEVAEQLFRRSTILPPPWPSKAGCLWPRGLYASLFNRMIVISDLRRPIPATPGRRCRSITTRRAARWPVGSRFPGAAPIRSCPGFHTSAETSLKHSGNGGELFYSLCGLMSTGGARC